MKTYWQASVNVDGQCKVSLVRDTLPLTIESAVESAIYYQAQYPDAAVSYELTEQCNCCHNEGEITVRKPRSIKRVRCPECKGKIPNGAMQVQFKMPEPCNNIRLLAS